MNIVLGRMARNVNSIREGGEALRDSDGSNLASSKNSLLLVTDGNLLGLLIILRFEVFQITSSLMKNIF